MLATSRVRSAVKLSMVAAACLWLVYALGLLPGSTYQPPPRVYACDGDEVVCTLTGAVAGQGGEPVPCTMHWVGGLWSNATYGEWPMCLHDMSGATVMSFGIGHDASFGMSLLKHAGVAAVHAYDPTLGDEGMGAVQPSVVPGFTLHQKGLGTATGTSTFMKPIAGYASFASNPKMAGQHYLRKGKDGKPITVTLPVDTVHGLAAMEGVSWTPLVKADVEGAEFPYFSDPALVAALPTSQVILEFHDRLLPDGVQQRAKVIDTFKAAGWTLQLQTVEQAVFLKNPLS